MLYKSAGFLNADVEYAWVIMVSCLKFWHSLWSCKSDLAPYVIVLPVIAPMMWTDFAHESLPVFNT